MAPRRPTSSATSLLSSSQLSRINSVFDYAGPPPSEPPAKRRRLNVVPDDEEEDFEMVASVDTGGGFLAEPEGAGGFFPEPESGGGFLPDDTGGDFLMDTSGDSGGGFLVDSPAPSPHIAAPLRTRTRIPLHAIPSALSALSLPSDSHDLLTLFADAASDDEEGIQSVPREKFVEACAVLLGDDDDEEKSSGNGSGDSGSEEYVAEVRGRVGGRRSTRANPVEGEEVEMIVLSSSEEEAQESGEERKGERKGKAVAKGRKGKQVPRKKDRDRVLSKEEMREAGDTFDLFFEGSSRWDGRAREERTIGLGELKNVAGLLNEKLADEEIAEMLEYASRSGGVVDLEAFTKVLAEAL